MYQRRSRISGKQQGKLLELFVVGATARASAEVTGLNRNTVRTFFHRLRELIASKQGSYVLSGEVEADESYFGGTRKGQRGRGAAGKVKVFGLLKRGGRVYTAIVPDCAASTLIPIISEQVTPDSIVYTDNWPAYNALDTSSFKHLRINHSLLFAEGRNHINGIENFWNQAKRHMRKFNSVPQQHFYLFLKECEWRFNGGTHQDLLSQLKCWYKSSKH